jgi:anti-sigma B factor antagonist
MYPRRWREVVRLKISIRERGDVSILDFWGKATIGRESQFLGEQLQNLFANGERKVLLNLANLAQIDSSGVSIIVQAYVFLKRQGGALKILCPSRRVLEVLRVLHLTNAIPIFENEIEALASFRAYYANA